MFKYIFVPLFVNILNNLMIIISKSTCSIMLLFCGFVLLVDVKQLIKFHKISMHFSSHFFLFLLKILFINWFTTEILNQSSAFINLKKERKKMVFKKKSGKVDSDCIIDHQQFSYSLVKNRISPFYAAIHVVTLVVLIVFCFQIHGEVTG